MLQPANIFKANWKILDTGPDKNLNSAYFTALGLFIGAICGAVISIFRACKVVAYNFVLYWTAKNETSLIMMACWLLAALFAAQIVGWLIRNPAIMSGGAPWIGSALENGQKHPWLKILLPKFLGSWLVLAFGISVGSEGPCVQMGAATALGLKKFDVKDLAERRFFILAGCAAGLAGAFSAPFAGLCYVYEIMNAKISRSLLIFLLSGSLGVYFTCNWIFGFGVIVSLQDSAMPSSWGILLLFPLGVIAGLIGCAYNYLLRVSIHTYHHLKHLPLFWQPALPFAVSAILVVLMPSLTGEGMDIFHRIHEEHLLPGFLCLFVVLKLLFTAFCYGSGIPAGMMVPILCLGGVTGLLFGDLTTFLGYSYHGWSSSCVAMGMAGAFAAAERAPITGLVLVLEITGAVGIVPGIFLAAAIGSFCARVCKITAL